MFSEETEELDDELVSIKGDLLDLTKTASNPNGISILKPGSSTEYKRLVDYFGEIHDAWSDFSDTQKTAFLNKAFAKTQAQAGAAIIENYDQIKFALEQMEGAAGSSEREMGIASDSISFRLNELKQTWVGIGQQFVTRGFIKDAIGGLTSLSEGFDGVINGVVGLRGVLSALIGTMVTMKSASSRALGTFDMFTGKWDKGWIKSGISGISQAMASSTSLGGAIKSGFGSLWKGGLASNLPSFTQNGVTSYITQNDLNILNQYNNAVLTGAANADQLKDEMLGLNNATATTSDAFRNYYNNQANAGKTSEQIAMGMTRIGVAARGMSIAVQAANMMINIGLSWLISWGLTKIIEVVDGIIHRVDNAKEAVKDMKSAFSDMDKSLESTAQTVDKACESIDKFADHVDLISGENIDLNDDEYDEFKDTLQDIAEVFPSLIKGVDEGGNYILDLGDNAKDAAEKLREMQKEYEGHIKYRKAMQLDENWNDIKIAVGDYVDEVSGADKALQRAQADFNRVNPENPEIKNFKFEGTEDEIKDFVATTLAGLAIAYEDYMTPSEIPGLQKFSLDLTDDIKQKLSSDQLAAIQGYYNSTTEQAQLAARDALMEAQTGYSNAVAELGAYWNDLLPSFMSAMTYSGNYQALDDSFQGLAVNILNSYDENLIKKIEGSGMKPSDALRSFITGPLWQLQNAMDNADVEIDVSKLFDENASIDEFNDVYTQVQTFADEHHIKLPIEFEYGGNENLYDKIKEKFADAPDEWVESLTPADARLVLSDEFEKSLDASFDEVEEAYSLRVREATDRLEGERKNLDNELRKLTEWAEGDLTPYFGDIVNGKMQSKFGNVNMDRRTIIKWSEQLKNLYADELASWKYDPEIGGIDTVFGGADDFVLDGAEIKVAFTPILVDKDGENPQFLSKETVKSYINDILNEADRQISESGEEWSQEKVFKRAIELDAAGMENASVYDSEGRKVGEQFIRGLISGIGDYTGEGGAKIDAELVSYLTHFVGLFGSMNIAQKGVADAEKELADATDAATNSFDKGVGAAEAYANALDEVKNPIAENIEKTASLQEVTDNLANKVQPGLSKIGELWDKVFPDGGGFKVDAIDVSALNDLKATLQGLDEDAANVGTIYFPEEAFEEFNRVLGTGKATAEEAQVAFNNLATAWLDSIGPLEGLDAEQIEYYQHQLEMMGAANSAEIVQSRLVDTHIKQQAATMLAAGATAAEVQGLMDEMAASEATRLAVFQLVLEQEIFSNQDLNVAGKVAEINQLASAYMSAANAAKMATDIDSIVSEGTSLGWNKDKITSEIQSYTNSFKSIDLPTVEFQKYAGAVDNAAKSTGGAADKAKEEEDILAKINKQIDDLQDAYGKLEKIQKQYNETGKISIDQAQELSNMDLRDLARLKLESNQLDLNKDAWDDVTKARINDLKIAMMQKTLDLIETFKNEETALKFIENSYIDAAKAGLTFLQVQEKVAAMDLNEFGQQAAEIAMKGLDNFLKMLENIDLDLHTDSDEKSSKDDDDSDKKDEEPKDSKKYADPEEDPEGYANEEIQHTYIDFIERALNKVTKTVEKWTDRVDKLFSFWNKNWAINQSINAIQTQISMQQVAAKKYLAQAKLAARHAGEYVGMEEGEVYIAGTHDLEKLWVDKIKNGAMEIADFTGHEEDDITQQKINEYINWYDKAIDAQEKINELYNQEVELIKQKMSTITEYFDSIQSYLDSVVSLVDAQIELKNAKGQRTSLSDVLHQFAAAYDSRENANEKLWAYVTGISKDEQRSSEEVAADIAKMSANIGEGGVYKTSEEIAGNLQDKKDNYDKATADLKETNAIVKKSTGDEKAAAKAEAKELKELKKIFKLSGAEKTSLKNNTKILDTLNDLYGVGETTDLDRMYDERENLRDSKKRKDKTRFKTIESLIETAESHGITQASESYLTALKEMDELLAEKAKQEAKGKSLGKNKAAKLSALQGVIQSIDEAANNAVVDSVVADSAIYKGLVQDLSKVQNKKNKTTADLKKWQMYLDEMAAISQGVMPEDLVNYRKTYETWWDLDNKKNTQGKILSKQQEKTLAQTEKQLAEYRQSYLDYVAELDDEMTDALINEGKHAAADRNYEKRSKEIEDLYDEREKAIEDDLFNTAQYKDILATIAKLEQTKATKKLTKKQQAQLEKLYQQRDALIEGATSANIADYLTAWNYIYNNKAKYDAGKLKGSNLTKYQKYQNQLAEWNKAKNDELLAIAKERSDALDKLKLEYDEEKANIEKEIAEKEKALWEAAKTAAEWTITNLQSVIENLDSAISEFNELIDVLENVSLDSIKSFPGVAEMLGIDDTKSLEDLFAENIYGALEKSKEKISTLVEKSKAQESLLNALKEGGPEAAAAFMDAYRTQVTEENKEWFDKTYEKLMGLGADEESLKQYIGIIKDGLSDEEKEQADSLLNQLLASYGDEDRREEFNTTLTSLQTIIGSSESALRALDLLKEFLLSGEYDDTNTWVMELEQGMVETKSETISTMQEMDKFFEKLRENVLFKAVDDAIKKLERLQSELSSVTGVFKDEWSKDVNGITKYGIAKASFLSDQYRNYNKQLDNYSEKVAKIDKAWEEGAYNGNYDKYMEERSAAVQSYYSTFSSMQDIASQLYELSRQQEEAEVNRIKKLVEARKNALNAKKAYYDYDKNVKNQQKEVDTLRAQIAALNGVTDAEHLAQKAQLEAQLSEAEESLDDLKMEHQFELSTDALDKFISDLEETIDDSTKTIDETLEKFVAGIKEAMSWTDGVDANAILNGMVGIFRNIAYGDVGNDKTVTLPASERIGDDAEGSGETTALTPDVQYDTVSSESFLQSLSSFGEQFIKPNLDMLTANSTQLTTATDMMYRGMEGIYNMMRDQKPIDVDLHIENTMTMNGTTTDDMQTIYKKCCSYTMNKLREELSRVGFYQTYR